MSERPSFIERPAGARTGAVLTIDLGALAANWRLLRDAAGSAECGAAVKADAYGIGAAQAARTLHAAGCRTFFVAHLAEGRIVRTAAPDAVVYVLNGLLPGSAPLYRDGDLRPVLGSRDELAEWAAFCRSEGTRRPAAIHVDTGMNRLGLRPREVAWLAQSGLLDEFTPALLMTHLVAAEEPGAAINAAQIARFAEARAMLPDLPASFCNSSGIFLAGAPKAELVRPGYALYGGNPVPGRPNPMRPVVRLEAPIVQLREVDRGETVGYGSSWTARGPRRIATLSIGYADGYPRAASLADGAADGTGGAAIVAGHLCPFAGRVSMDLIGIDVSAVPPDAVARGDLVTLIGEALDLDEVARRAGTNGYEILTRLGHRFERRYLGPDGA